MKIEVRINIRPFSAIILAKDARPCADSPRVSDRNMGVLPIGLTIGNSAPTTRRMFFTRSLRASFINCHCTGVRARRTAETDCVRRLTVGRARNPGVRSPVTESQALPDLQLQPVHHLLCFLNRDDKALALDAARG